MSMHCKVVSWLPFNLFTPHEIFPVVPRPSSPFSCQWQAEGRAQYAHNILKPPEAGGVFAYPEQSSGPRHKVNKQNWALTRQDSFFRSSQSRQGTPARFALSGALRDGVRMCGEMRPRSIILCAFAFT